MDEQNKPRSRVKKVVNTGKGLGKKSEGTGTGPVNNTGNYAARQEQERARQQQAPRTGAAQSRPQQAANPFAAQRPQQQNLRSLNRSTPIRQRAILNRPIERSTQNRKQFPRNAQLPVLSSAASSLVCSSAASADASFKRAWTIRTTARR